MEKRIAASWCLPGVERTNRTRCSGLHDFPAPKIQAKAGTQKRRAVSRAVFVIASEAKQSSMFQHWIASSLRSSQ
jgi:hypothetical protein